jgi:hypothetical protein
MKVPRDKAGRPPDGTFRRTYPKNVEGISRSYRFEFLGFPRRLCSIVKLFPGFILGGFTSVHELLS